MNFDTPMFTLIHVVISVLGIVTGLVVVGGMIASRYLVGWTALFLLTTIMTSVTGFGFPFKKIGPPHVVGAISIVVLIVCVVARYRKRLQGGWRPTYVITAVAALYLNVFVLVVQLFANTTALEKLAPTQQEPPFVATQLLVLVVFLLLAWAAVRGVRKENSG